jgi:phosphohistidine phosphatase
MKPSGMKTLVILRHAKSSWKDASLQDFNRPLNSRGKRAAEVIGRFIRKQKLKPDLVLSSPAVRARETIDIVLKSARLQVELRYDERIYEADPMRLLEVISQVEEDRKVVLLVGHNPGLEELLKFLTGQPEHLPTAALVKITLGTDKWSEISAKKGKLEWLVKPKELIEA